MATGLASGEAAKILDALVNATNYTAPTAVWINLHTGDPGSAGTANAAGNTTRQQLSAGAATGGTATSDAALTWTNVSTSEDYTHYSAWTASTGGTFLFSGPVTANAVTAGDTFTIAIGDFDLSLTVAS